MNTTKEEAIAQIEKLKSYCEYTADSDESGAYLFDLAGQALDLALSALCPVSREAADALKQLQAENDRLKEKVQQMWWIPVEERLPVVQGEYIVTACDEGCPYGEGIWYSTVVVVADYYKGCWTWDDYSCEYDISDIVTHWMPLPKAPKEGEP